MCPDCEVLRTPRSKHCAICNRCVERFDHHCPWINTCVGIHNHNAFLTFIVFLLIDLVLITISSIISLTDPCHIINNPDNCPLGLLCVGCQIEWLKYCALIVTILITIFFGGPGMMLCYIHLRNYMAGKTTNERYAKQTRRANSEVSEDTYTTTS